MKWVLFAAAGYNLIWGGWVVLFPSMGFELAGLTPPRYPQIWQCVGMIVGVYGVGYAIAALDPMRHWPIVFVGLLGKVLGPLGFLDAAVRGTLPWAVGWTILTNDLIWWVPFGLILGRAWQGRVSVAGERRGSLRWIPSAIRQFEAAGAVRARSWSLAQTCEHLALAVEGTVRDPESDVSPRAWRALGLGARWRRTFARHALLLTGWFPRGAPAPQEVVPSDAPDLATMLQRLELAIEAFEDKLARPAARWVDHPLLGKMSGRQWRRFHAIHARHHLRLFRAPVQP